jgi:hypothetical protein
MPFLRNDLAKCPKSKIYYNYGLSECCAIQDLINEVAPKFVGGTIYVFFNQSGCDNVPDINATCIPAPGIADEPGDESIETTPCADCIPADALLPDKDARPLGLTVVPNPNHGSFIVRLERLPASEVNVRVTDLAGRICFDMEAKVVENQSLELPIDLPCNEPGMYFLQVESGGKRKAERIVKF